MRRVYVCTLLLSVSLSAAAATVSPVTDATATNQRAISTGVTDPHLVYTTHISIPAQELPDAVGAAKVVLAVALDETGTPTSIRVLQPVSQSVDYRVVSGVRKFRWSPAVLNNKTVPSVLTLTVEVQR